ncbi:hypothetical protein [Streptomyces sp. NPDC056527]|uniref:hypothetical protein n=1 Tax=Streptomyces sp. NPDC056527 TaxID=3345853 RepID=UPI003678C8D2
MSYLSDDVAAQGWLVHALDVLTTDALWSQALASERLPTGEMDRVADLGDALRNKWLQVTDDKTLTQIERYLHQQEHQIAEQAARLESGTPDGRTLVEKAIGSIRNLHRLRETEASELDEKTVRLRESTWTPGDLSERATCALFFVACVVVLALDLTGAAVGLWAWFLATKCRSVVLGLSEA